QLVPLGTVELGPVPKDKSQTSQVVLIPLKEQHDNMVATKLIKHVHDGIIDRPNIEEPSHGILL
ncbi:MAG: hypothetical protein ACKPKO_28030, partial [Candidatus Fonsibacter sp.]